MRTSNRPWWIGAAAVLVLIAQSASLTGQQSANPDVLNALLVEVRGLRAAMEQMASAGPRVQLAMARLQLQEQRVNTMLRRLDTLREQIANVERDTARARDQLVGLEELARQAESAEIRQNAADETRGLKKALERLAVDLQRLQVEEAEVSATVAAEQGRWADINKRLEDLELELIRR